VSKKFSALLAVDNSFLRAKKTFLENVSSADVINFFSYYSNNVPQTLFLNAVILSDIPFYKWKYFIIFRKTTYVTITKRLLDRCHEDAQKKSNPSVNMSVTHSLEDLNA